MWRPLCRRGCENRHVHENGTGLFVAAEEVNVQDEAETNEPVNVGDTSMRRDKTTLPPSDRGPYLYIYIYIIHVLYIYIYILGNIGS